MDMKIKYLDCFSWAGWFHLALEQSIWKENVDCIGYSEIDKFAKQVYNERFPNSKDLWSITELDIANLEDFDLLTWWFPCQDVSVAWKQNLDGGRTVLVEYLLKILEEKKPKYFVFENVKGLMSSKFEKFRESILERMRVAWYEVTYKVLNTKDFWLPQNRERIFIVWTLYKTLEDKVYNFFNFPRWQELTTFLKDILEDKVDEKYYYKSDLYEKLVEEDNKVTDFPKHTYKVNISGHDILKRAYSKNWISPTLNSCGWWNRQSKVVLNIHPSWKWMNWNVYRTNTESPTLTTNKWEWIKILDDVRIRKLTPTEYERLQWFPDWWSTDYVSDSQTYKQMWNAISVPVVKSIFDNLLK